MSIAHVISSILLGTASVSVGIWITRKYGAKYITGMKDETPSFTSQAKTAKEDVSDKAETGARNLADVLSDIESKRSDL